MLKHTKYYQVKKFPSSLAISTIVNPNSSYTFQAYVDLDLLKFRVPNFAHSLTNACSNLFFSPHLQLQLQFQPLQTKFSFSCAIYLSRLDTMPAFGHSQEKPTHLCCFGYGCHGEPRSRHRSDGDLARCGGLKRSVNVRAFFRYWDYAAFRVGFLRPRPRELS